MRPTWLHTTLRISNLLQNPPTILQTLRIQILLLRNLRQQHPQLVTYITNSIILGALAPLAQLARDRSRFFGGGFVGADGVVLGLDEAVEALGELGLLRAAEGGEGEVVFAAGLRGGCAGVAALGADGVGAADVPGRGRVSMGSGRGGRGRVQSGWCSGVSLTWLRVCFSLIVGWLPRVSRLDLDVGTRQCFSQV